MGKKRIKKVDLPEVVGVFDYANFESSAIAGLQSGKSLLGSEGVLTTLVQRLVNAALSGEMTAHLASEQAQGLSNRRNGLLRKQLDTDLGKVEIQTPRDRSGRFVPHLVGKWERQLGGGLDAHILSLYAHGMSYESICCELKKLYGLDYSPSSITAVTESVWEDILVWQQRPLLPFYVTIYLDGIYFRTRENGKSGVKVVYSVYGVDAHGNRDVLGIYLNGSESASQWGRILQDLRKRGVEDVLFCCVDGLTGLSDVIFDVFPKTTVQRCIVHMIRSSTALLGARETKAICVDLRRIYTAADETQAQIALTVLKQKWDKTQPQVSQAWEKNWDDLIAFLAFDEPIRRMIYTTNPVEALHRQIRKVTKTKGSWTSDKALIKQIYITLHYGTGGWNRKVNKWAEIAKQLSINYGQRFEAYFMLRQ